MLLIMAGVTLVLLFLAFGSVVLPVKAVLVNVLSVGAAFGVLVWGFQYGHLSGILRFTATPYLEPTTLVLVLRCRPAATAAVSPPTTRSSCSPVSARNGCEAVTTRRRWPRACS